jgi:hypothetical protein
MILILIIYVFLNLIWRQFRASIYMYINTFHCCRCNPILSMVIDTVKESKKVSHLYLLLIFNTPPPLSFQIHNMLWFGTFTLQCTRQVYLHRCKLLISVFCMIACLINLTLYIQVHVLMNEFTVIQHFMFLLQPLSNKITTCNMFKYN